MSQSAPQVESSPAHRLTSGLRTPFRAAVSVTIAILVGEIFGLQRAYWAILVSILLVNGSWGENTRKGLTRFGMTLVGCAAGWGLDWLCGGHENIEIAVMVSAIFLAVYFRPDPNAYWLLTFFVTVYIIMLFPIIGTPAARITIIRSYETCIGCAVALAASILIPPPRATAQWLTQLHKLRDSCRTLVERAFSKLISGQGLVLENDPAARELLGQLHALRKQHRAAMYEGIFRGPSRRQRSNAMNQAKMLARTTLSLSEATESLGNSRAPGLLRDELSALCDVVAGSFQSTDQTSDDHPAPFCKPADLDAAQSRLRERAIALIDSHRLSPADLAWVGPVVYYSRQLCTAIHRDALWFDDGT